MVTDEKWELGKTTIGGGGQFCEANCEGHRYVIVMVDFSVSEFDLALKK